MDFLISAPYQIITEFIIPLNVGLFIVFSLAFMFLQIIVSFGNTSFQIDKKHSDICKVFLSLFEIIQRNCDLLTERISKVWKCCLCSLTIIFVYLFLTIIYDVTLFFLFYLIIFINFCLLYFSLTLHFYKSYIEIRDAVKSIIHKNIQFRTRRKQRVLVEMLIEEEIEKQIKLLKGRKNRK